MRHKTLKPKIKTINGIKYITDGVYRIPLETFNKITERKNKEEHKCYTTK